MWEIVWSILAIVGLRSYAARPLVFVIFVNLVACYAANFIDHNSLLANGAVAVVDVWATSICVMIGMNDPKARQAAGLIVMLFAASLINQGAYWLCHFSGWYIGVWTFILGHVIVTAQLLVVSWVGGRDLVQDWRRFSSTWASSDARGKVGAFGSFRNRLHRGRGSRGSRRPVSSSPRIARERVK